MVAPGLISLPSSLVGINRKEEGYFHSSPVSSLSSIVVGGREGRKRTQVRGRKLMVDHLMDGIGREQHYAVLR